MLRPGMRFADPDNHRVLEIQVVSNHWKSPEGVCSCGGRECKPNPGAPEWRPLKSWLPIPFPARRYERLQIKQGKRSPCVCGGKSCFFLPDGSCGCNGVGCPYLPVAIAMQHGGSHSGVPVAMPAARFVGDNPRYQPAWKE